MPPATSQRRVIMRIELYPEAKQGLTDLCDRLGMTQVAACSRILEWVATQNEIIQATILGLYPRDIRPQIAELILRHMAAEKKKS